MTEGQTNTKGPLNLVVTGASRGYGAAIVRELAELCDEANIIVTARCAKGLQELRDSISKTKCTIRVICIPGDLKDPVISKEIQAWISSHAGGLLHGILHNAGIVQPLGRLRDVEVQSIRDLFEINLFCVIQLTHDLMPFLRAAKGRVVLVSSGAATSAYAGMSAYCMSKAALGMYAKCLAIEEPEITCVALRPGVLDTQMQAELREQGGSGILDAGVHQFFCEMHQNKTLVDPRKSAAVAARLAFFAPSDISGQLVDWEDTQLNARLLQIMDSLRE